MSGEQIFSLVIQSGIFSVFLGLVISLIKFAKTLIDAKTAETLNGIKNANVKESLELAKDCVSTVVLELSQTVVDKLKEKAADGKLTEEEIAEVKKIALEKITSLMSENVYGTISEIFGNAENWINEKIESEVKKMKLQV